ncbi:YraN family protein [Prevotella dentasini]|uniref:YraN family protein n=1 Tax=Prevotella dentasini TaxID=589537 RepID=UPI000469C3CC|nr:YraN family protein [Prevotella dentasini]
MAQHNDLGRWGEDLAEKYLREGGYRVLARDWKHGHRDLDIVAIENDVLVIVEVKTRCNERHADADMAVTPQKVRSLAMAANAYVKNYCFDGDIRFDIITVVGTPETGVEVRHVKDAFLPFV